MHTVLDRMLVPADGKKVSAMLSMPAQGLDSAQGPGIMKMGDEVFQRLSFPVAENKGRHQFTLAIPLTGDAMG